MCVASIEYIEQPGYYPSVDAGGVARQARVLDIEEAHVLVWALEGAIPALAVVAPVVRVVVSDP